MTRQPPAVPLPWVRVIDLHCHILPGIDDGPGSVRDAILMARAAVDAGTTTIACTSHMHPRYPTPPGVVHDAVRDLQGRLDALDVPLRLVPGGELSLEWLPRMDDADLGMACLGDGGHLPVTPECDDEVGAGGRQHPSAIREGRRIAHLARSFRDEPGLGVLNGNQLHIRHRDQMPKVGGVVERMPMAYLDGGDSNGHGAQKSTCMD